MPISSVQRCKYAPDEDATLQCNASATWHLYIGNPWDPDHRETRACDEHRPVAHERFHVVDEHPIDPDCSVPVRAWQFPSITEVGYCLPGDEWNVTGK
ncbi:hypothetical protein HQQ80_06945 [Microbacteriaceae bacterium VKM Ac-2855]|nr:hypothetical protein [Microbacteriaceae bacterium VKM Ac-2855]